MIDEPDASTPEPETHGGFVERRAWEPARCRSCTRLLCKHTRDAVRPGKMIEIKCGGCNALNYIMGPLEV